MLLFLLCMILSLTNAFEPVCDCACNQVDRNRLGQSTWYLLHEIAKHVPKTRESHFKNLMYSLSYVYPCEICRDHIDEYILKNGVELSDEWVCRFHNDVNMRLKKPLFDCSAV